MPVLRSDLLSRISWKVSALALICAGALFFLYLFGLTRTGLIGPDEPRYAWIGRAMAETGDWVTPRLWGEPWFEKPPMLYWMAAAAFKAGLGDDLAPRLPVALTSVAFLVFFFFVLRREFGARAAFYAASILATSAGWLAYSHVAVTDLPLAATFAAGLLLMQETKTTRAAAVAGVLLGLAVLAKGLVPLVLFLPVLWFLRTQLRRILVMTVAAAVVALPWYVLVTLRNGTAFLADFFWKHHFERFTSASLLHERPVWFFVPVLAAGLFPWTPMLALLASKRLYAGRTARLLLAWFAWGFLFFSISRNKLPGYLLPLLPAVAALLGIAIEQARERSGKVVALLAASAALLWFIPAIGDVLPQALAEGLSRTQIPLPWAWIPAALAIVAACAALERSGKRPAAIAVIAFVATLSVIGLVTRVYPLLDREVSAREYWLSHSKSAICMADANRSWKYGLSYYAHRELSDCN